MGKRVRFIANLALCLLLPAAAAGCGGTQERSSAVDALTFTGFRLTRGQPVHVSLHTSGPSGFHVRIQIEQEEQDPSMRILKVESDGGESRAAPLSGDVWMRRRNGVDTYEFRTQGDQIPGTYRLELRGQGRVLALEVKTF